MLLVFRAGAGTGLGHNLLMPYLSQSWLQRCKPRHCDTFKDNTCRIKRHFDFAIFVALRVPRIDRNDVLREAIEMTFHFAAALQAEPSSASVLRSWQRCMARESDMQPDPVMLVRGELNVRLAQHASLLQAAQPEIDTLSNMVGRHAGIVLLADATGVILQTAGNTSFLQQAESVALQPGVSWAEQHRGTNAIGTALLENTPVRVHGAEHYLHCNRILSCHGAPVWSPRGDRMGVLDISGEASQLHDYALGLAALCSRLITNRMMQQSLSGRELLVFQRQPSLLESTERALLLLEDGHIVGANDLALSLLRTSWSDLLDQPAQRWLGEWQQLGQEATLLRAPDGESFYASLFRNRTLIPVGAAFPASSAVSLAASAASAPVSPPAAAHASPPTPAASPARPVRPEGQASAETPPREERPAGVRPHPALAPKLALDPQLSTRFDAVRRAFDGGLGVFLQGETGAGKEIYARRLHAASRWRNGPFVAVNCGALPESLIEAELFGYEAGAFTGARRNGSRGRLREADGGVLFLDEIGDMPLSLQTRLLRALQERAVQPLGSDRLIPVEFGLISATHRDIGALVQAEQFRNDLFYRLHDLRVNLPPLRERADFRSYVCSMLHATAGDALPLTLDDSALDQLTRHPWPGNYRELQAFMRTLSVMSAPGSVITAADVAAYLQNVALPGSQASNTAGSPPLQPASPSDTGAAASAVAADAPPAPRTTPAGLRDATLAMIEQTLAACSGNVSQAARRLGIHRSTIYRHLERDPGLMPPHALVRARG